MANIGEDTMHELEDILNEGEDENRLAAFLKLKTATRSQNNPQFMLGGCDISFDVDVDLVKLPAKPSQTECTEKISTCNTQKEMQREIVCNSIPRNGQNLVIDSQPQPELSRLYELQKIAPRRSLSASPGASLSRACGNGKVGSSQIRCVDIRSISQRQTKASSTLDASVLEFFPELVSHPAVEKLAEKQLKSAGLAGVAGANEGVGTTCAADFETSYLASLMQMKSTGNLPLALSNEKASQRSSVTVIESSSCNPTTKAPSQQICVEKPNSQLSLSNGKASQRSSVTVIQSSSCNPTTKAPSHQICVEKPNSQLSLSNGKASQRSSVTVIESSSCNPTTKVPSQQICVEKPNSQLSLKPAIVYLKRLTQSEYIEPKIASPSDDHPAQIADPNQDEVGINEDSNVENISSKAPLNLAPIGDKLDRQRPVRKRVQADKNSNFQLLDLHNSASNISIVNNAKNAAKPVLNKPSRPAINGEEFAQELTRMSHYEILDLRKRNSMGLLFRTEVQTTISREDQLVIEQRIESELLRRQADDNTEAMAYPQPLNTSTVKSNEAISYIETMQPPAATLIHKKNKSIRKQREQQRRTTRPRSRRREVPMTDELRNYLRLSETIEMRLKSGSNSKTRRSLYTKGNSDVEENESQSPPNTQLLCYKEIEIAPGPPNNTASNDHIPIVPPPPASIRYSQAMCKSRRIMSNEHEKHREEDQQQKEAQPQKKKTQKEQPEKEQPQKEQPHLQEDYIPFVPPPPASIRYSQAMYKSRRSKRIMSNEQEEEDQQHEDDVPIVPPPPASLRYSQAMCKSRRWKRIMSNAQHDDDLPIVPPPTTSIRYVPTQNMTNEQEHKQQMELEQVDVQQEWQATDNSSMHMETLRMETPTPPPSIQDKNQLSEEPSTSKASRLALELSLSRKKKESNKQKKQSRGMQKRKKADDKIFKQSLTSGSGGQKRKTQMDKELSKLHINLISESLSPVENELSHEQDTTVRRSRRGHVPLRNTWCHTLNDPFAFMREIGAGNKSKMKSYNHESAVNRPRSTTHKRKREVNNEEEHPQKKIRVRVNKRAGKGNTAAVEPTPQTQSVSDDLLPQANIDDAMELPEVGPMPFVAQSENQNSKLISWLRGVSNAKPVTNNQTNGEYKSMCTSSVAELEFSNLGGIEYAFYCTEDVCALGYMRFQPLQQRGMTQNKTNRLSFVVLFGQFKVESSCKNSVPLEQFVLNAGDMVEIKQGSRFNITNLLNEVGVMIVNRRCKNGDSK